VNAPTNDDLRTLWQQLDRRLDAMAPALRTVERLARERAVRRARSRFVVPWLAFGWELALGVAGVVLAGSYLARVWSEPRFAVPALILHVAAILAIVVAARQIHGLATLDLAAPVVEAQRRLAELGLLRARSNRAILFASPLVWAALAVAVPHAVVGLDVVAAFGPGWVLGNFGVGVAVLALGFWAARRFPAARWLRALGDDLTGRRLAEASERLADLAGIEDHASASADAEV
jgi:hypothetical protein